MPAQRYTDAPGIAEYMGFSTDAVWKMVQRGQIPHNRLPNGRIRFDLRAVDRWLDAHRVEVVDT